MSKFNKTLYPAFLWALLIGVLCAIPGKDLPHSDWLEMLSFDKFVHAGIFGVQFYLTARGFLYQDRSTFFRKYHNVAAIILSIAYGGLMEILQGALFVERSADIYDFIANSFGVLICYYVAFKKELV